VALKAVIHVNQHVIKANRKNGTDYPVLTVKTYKETRYTNKVTINGPSEIVYKPNDPLKCGAHCWIVCSADDLKVDGISLTQ